MTTSSPPAHVFDIRQGQVLLTALTTEIKSRLVNAGLELREQGCNTVVLFDAEPADLRKNTSAIRVLSVLQQVGCNFLEDGKLTYSPNYSMQYLREAGLITGTSMACAFDGKQWRVWKEPPSNQTWDPAANKWRD